jgi:hypothetical protein
MNHALVKLARTVDWRFLEERFTAVYQDKLGRPALPTRLMAALAILKHIYDLSDEVLCEHWVENPYYQFFCGEEFFQHRLTDGAEYGRSVSTIDHADRCAGRQGALYLRRRQHHPHHATSL